MIFAILIAGALALILLTAEAVRVINATLEQYRGHDLGEGLGFTHREFD